MSITDKPKQTQRLDLIDIMEKPKDQQLHDLIHRVKCLEERLANNEYTESTKGNIEDEDQENDSYKMFMDYTKISTCHALVYMFNVRYHTVRRFLWTIAFLGGVAFSLAIAITSSIYYASHPSTSSYEYVSAENLVYPAVTICFSSPVKSSYIEQQYEKGVFLSTDERFVSPSDEMNYIKMLVKTNKLFLELTGAINNSPTDTAVTFFLENTDLGKQIASRDNKNESASDIVKDMVKQGKIDLQHNLAFFKNVSSLKNSRYITVREKTLIELLLMKMRDELDNIDLEKAFKEGGMKADELMFDSLKKCGKMKFQFGYEIPISCQNKSYVSMGAGLCHTLDLMENGTEVAAINGFGLSTLSLDFKVNTSEFSYFYDLVPHPAILMQFHQPETYASIQNYDFIIEGGFDYEIHLQQIKQEVLPLPFHNCINTNDYPPSYAFGWQGNYSYNLCVQDCIYEDFVKFCGCYQPGLYVPSYPPCKLKQMIECKAVHKYAVVHHVRCSKCKMPCYQQKFKSSMVSKIANDDPSKAGVVLHYPDFSYIKIKEKQSYSFGSFLGDIGGQANLILGVSLLTLLEFLDLLAVIVLKKCSSYKEM